MSVKSSSYIAIFGDGVHPVIPFGMTKPCLRFLYTLLFSVIIEINVSDINTKESYEKAQTTNRHRSRNQTVTKYNNTCNTKMNSCNYTMNLQLRLILRSLLSTNTKLIN